MSVARQLNLCAPLRIADRYRLKQIKFPQNLVYVHMKGQRAVVQDVAAVLGVLVYWGFDGFREFQGALADIVTDICQPTNKRGEPVTYSKNQITKALADLQRQNLIYIPRRITRESIDEKHAKTLTFKPRFKTFLSFPKANLSAISGNTTATQKHTKPQTPVKSRVSRTEAGGTIPAAPNYAIKPPAKSRVSRTEAAGTIPPARENLSHTSPPLPKTPTYKNPVIYSSPNSETPCFNRNNNHAHTRETKRENSHPREHGLKNPSRKTETRTAPQRMISAQKTGTGTAIKRDMQKTTKQIIHWLSGCTILAGETESLVLSGRFMENLRDERIEYWLEKWPSLLNSEKSFAVRQIIGVLRQLPAGIHRARPVSPPPVAPKPPEPTREQLPAGFNLQKFRESLIMGREYSGPGAGFIARFHAANDEIQEIMLLDFKRKVETGKLGELLKD